MLCLRSIALCQLNISYQVKGPLTFPSFCHDPSYLMDEVHVCVGTCLEQTLMRAAGYGKSFLSDYDSDEFVECCRKLRVLNNCRQEAGIPITSHQYDRLTPEVRQRG